MLWAITDPYGTGTETDRYEIDDHGCCTDSFVSAGANRSSTINATNTALATSLAHAGGFYRFHGARLGDRGVLDARSIGRSRKTCSQSSLAARRTVWIAFTVWVHMASGGAEQDITARLGCNIIIINWNPGIAAGAGAVAGVSAPVSFFGAATVIVPVDGVPLTGLSAAIAGVFLGESYVDCQLGL
jgi:hypothetical protein